jgi:Ca-activated chloride channel family protein
LFGCREKSFIIDHPIDVYVMDTSNHDVEEMATYKYGGEKGLIKFLMDSIKYPNDSVEGMVYVSFVIDTLGKVNSPQILRGLSDETNEDAIRVAKMLEFNPATKNGKKISQEYNLPVKYKKLQR